MAYNVSAFVKETQKKRFDFSTIAQLAAIGQRTGVASILGLNFSGFLAWWLWRTIYLSKLPRFEKKLRVAFDWTLDLIFSKDLVQFLNVRAPMMSRPEVRSSQREGPSGSEPHYTGLIAFGGFGPNPGLPPNPRTWRMTFGRRAFWADFIMDESEVCWFVNLPSEQPLPGNLQCGIG